MVEQEQRLSTAIENYLKTIYVLQQQGQTVSTTVLAEQLGVRPASVSGMLKKLAELNLVQHTPYYGVAVSPAGEKIALEVLRHHRLIELYLVEALGYTWDEVHAEAEELEHVISEKLEARISAWLGNPTHDPHGDPIPTLELQLPQEDRQPLVELEPGQGGMVGQVSLQDGERLRYLASLGLTPGAAVRMETRAPFDGPVTVTVGTTEPTSHVLDARLAKHIILRDIQ
jgi:DtxR family transcriptional regulator, Mn-dependent transcriptional regulator